MDITEVIIKPLVTEKTHNLRSLEKPRLSFLVNKDATKIQIQQAFSLIFGIKPAAVNTVTRKPQQVRHTKFSRKNYTSTVKIAYITVSKADLETLKNKLESEKEAK